MPYVTKMNNKTDKSFYAIICVILALCIGFIGISQTIARATEQKTYVEDVKIYEVEEDDDSASRAKSWFESKGYVYTGINLNAGTKTDTQAFLGYKTTTNRDMAITDIRMMAMDTGYTLYNYKDMMNYIASQKAGTAQTMYAASVAFKDNYNAGSPKAIDAYNGLNIFNCGDEKHTKLGDYIISGKADTKFFVQMLMKSTTGTLNAVHGFLINGIAPYKNDVNEKGKIVTTNWAQFAVKSELWEYINSEDLSTDEINDLHKDYNDLARELFKTVQNFATYYEDAKARESIKNEIPDAETMEDATEDMEDVEREDCDFLYLSAYEMLNEYSLADGTLLGDWFIALGKMTSDNVDLMQLYPIVEAMGDCQCEISSSGGFVSAVLNLAENKHNEDFQDALDETQEKLSDLTEEGTFNIWENCDGDLENATIAFTSDAVRKSTAENALGRKSKWEKKKEMVEQIEKYANLVMGIMFAALPVLQLVLTLAVFVTKMMAATCIAMAALNTMCVWLLAVVTFLNSVLPFISLLIMIATITAIVTIYVKEAIMGDKVHIDKQSDKPTVIFDAQDREKEVIDVKYNSVLNDSGEVSDINGGEQVYWCLLAYTKDDQIGSPLCADDTGNIFKSVTGNAAALNGYDCVKFFGERSAADCNAYCKKNEINGNYIYYRTEASVSEQNAVPQTQPSQEDSQSDSSQQEEKNYIGDIIVCTGKNTAEAKGKIVRHSGKYYVYDYNLSPDCEQATYIGYTMTTDPKSAVTDIRVAPYVGVSQATDHIMLGSVQYTRIDILGAYINYGDEKTKPQADCLYFTTDKNAGEPILADGLHAVTKAAEIKEGWEPVSVFSGMPYDFNTSLINDDFADPTEVAWLNDKNITTVSGFMSEEDETDALNKHRTVYLYTESSKMYTSGTKYLSGLFFIGGYDQFDNSWTHSEKEQYISDFKAYMKKQYRTGVCDTNLLESLYPAKYVCWNHMQSYLCYTWSYSPKRALYNIEAYQGNHLTVALNYTMSKGDDSGALQNYVSVTCLYQQDFGLGNARFIRSMNNYVNAYGSGIGCYNFEKCIYDDGYTDKLPEGIEFGYKKIPFLPTGLYVSGYTSGGKALTLDDVVFSTKAYTADDADGKLKVTLSGDKTLGGNSPTGAFHAVSEMKNPRNKKPFNLSTPDYYYDGEFRASGGSFYIYLSGTKFAKRKYISGLSVGAYSRAEYRKTNPKGKDVDEDDEKDELKAVDLMVEGTAMASAASGCSDEVVIYNAATDSQKDAWYNRIEDEDDDIAFQEAAEDKPAAYIGVTRTDVKGNGDDDKSQSAAEEAGTKVEKKKPITGVLLYKLNDTTSPNVLEVDSVKYYCANTSVPIEMKGTKYYLYYSYSKGAFPGEPIEEIKIDNIPIISGYSTNVCADKGSTAPYGNPKQTNYIHLKYSIDPRKDFFNKIYIGTGDSARAAQCDLLTQGCMEYIDLDASLGVKGKGAYIGFRRGHLDLTKIDGKATESAKAKERNSQLKEAVYDIIITNDEPYHEEGIVRNNIYYKPVGNKDLTNGMGHKLYMYYASQWYSSRYNSVNNAGTYLPQDVFTGFISSFALARYDRVPYNTSLASTNSDSSVKPWEYVMLADNSRPCDLNEGTISFDTTDSYSHYAIDNRITMFVQRSDGSIKPAGEITGGFVDRSMAVGNASIN